MNKPAPRTALKATGMRRRYARCLETELAAERAIVSRIWVQLGSPTYAQLKGRSIHDLIDDLKAELATERARLDWLEGNAGDIPKYNSRSFIWFANQNIRAAIDEAMKEGAK